MKSILWIASVFLVLSACKNDSVGPAPTADLILSTSYSTDDTRPLVTVATYEEILLNAGSENADAYFWDFGNGATSTDKNAHVHYTKSGTYTLTLTVSSKDGRTAVASRTVKALDRVVKKVVVESLNPESALGWGEVKPTSPKMNVWVELLQAGPNQTYPRSSFGVPQAPVVYKSTVAANVGVSEVPLEFEIPGGLVIDMPTLNRCCGNIGYILNVYAQDATGTYLLASNHGSGIGSSVSGNLRDNHFEFRTGFYGTNMSLNGMFQ